MLGKAAVPVALVVLVWSSEASACVPRSPVDCLCVEATEVWVGPVLEGEGTRIRVETIHGTTPTVAVGDVVEVTGLGDPARSGDRLVVFVNGTSAPPTMSFVTLRSDDTVEPDCSPRDESDIPLDRAIELAQMDYGDCSARAREEFGLAEIYPCFGCGAAPRASGWMPAILVALFIAKFLRS